MPRFLTGDELGSIKSVSYDPDASSANKLLLRTLHDGTPTGRTRGVQKLAISGPTRVRVSCSSRTERDKIMLKASWLQDTQMGPFASLH